jgi:hypothetical protein
MQDLDGIEDKPANEETECIWLTSTPLSSQSDMDTAICQVITTKLTIHGTKGGSTNTSVTWTHFYNMVLLNAKLLDRTRSKQNKQIEILVVILIAIIFPEV